MIPDWPSFDSFHPYDILKHILSYFCSKNESDGPDIIGVDLSIYFTPLHVAVPSATLWSPMTLRSRSPSLEMSANMEGEEREAKRARQDLGRGFSLFSVSSWP